MTMHHKSTSTDIAEHIIEAARTDARQVKRARAALLKEGDE